MKIELVIREIENRIKAIDREVDDLTSRRSELRNLLRKIELDFYAEKQFENQNKETTI